MNPLMLMLESSSGSGGMGGLKHTSLFPGTILILLDNEMLNLMPTIFKEAKSFKVLGLIWMTQECRKKIRQVKIGIVHRP